MPPLGKLLPLLGIGMMARGAMQNRPQQEPQQPLGEQRPEAPDVGALREPGEAVIAAEQQREAGQLAAEREDQQRALDLGEEVRQGREETVAGIEETRTGLQAEQERLQADIATQQEQLQEIPGQITAEFDRLRQEFGQQADVAFDRIDQQREEAMGQVFQGQSMAMEAAVQGIQGQINSQVSQIEGNPNLTAAQKQTMIAQVKLQGASSMSPAIGATVLQFNQLAADTATKFGAITGQLEGTVLTQQAGLIGMQGSAFSQAQQAVGQMTNQLLEVSANSSVAFANSQANLLAQRSQAEMASNDVLRQLLPEQGTPFADITGSATARLQFENDLMMKQFSMDLQEFGMDVQIAMLQSMQGNPLQNAFFGAMQGFAMGGPAGAFMGAAGGWAGSQGPQV